MSNPAPTALAILGQGASDLARDCEVGYRCGGRVMRGPRRSYPETLIGPVASINPDSCVVSGNYSDSTTRFCLTLFRSRKIVKTGRLYRAQKSTIHTTEAEFAAHARSYLLLSSPL